MYILYVCGVNICLICDAHSNTLADTNTYTHTFAFSDSAPSLTHATPQRCWGIRERESSKSPSMSSLWILRWNSRALAMPTSVSTPAATQHSCSSFLPPCAPARAYTHREKADNTCIDIKTYYIHVDVRIHTNLLHSCRRSYALLRSLRTITFVTNVIAHIETYKCI